MISKKPISMLLAILILNAAQSCCASSSISIYPVHEEKLAAPIYGEQNPSVLAAADGANDFAFRLSAELLSNGESANFICSPYSVWLPLAALMNVTDVDSQDALLTALGAGGLNVEDINLAASRMLYDLTKEGVRKDGVDAHNPLQMVNAIFVDENAIVNGEFAQTFADYYRGQTIAVDFGSPDAVDTVNQWARKQTGGLIDNVIQHFASDTIVAIANSIYFSDRWEWEYKVEQTTESSFYGRNGQSIANYMLREGDNQTYYEDDRLQAMPLRFKSGGSLYILLPKDGDAVGLLKTMDAAYFAEIQNDSIQASGKLLLPRFTIDGDAFSLNEALESLGVPLFNKQAIASGRLIEANIPVWLSSVVQKAKITVDEKGTTAAAITVMAAAGAAMPEPTESFEMVCNKPFVFILYDSTYDGGIQILFTGIVNQPEID